MKFLGNFLQLTFFFRIDMLSKLNYAKDVELQSQRAQMEAMQVCLCHFIFVFHNIFI